MLSRVDRENEKLELWKAQGWWDPPIQPKRIKRRKTRFPRKNATRERTILPTRERRVSSPAFLENLKNMAIRMRTHPTSVEQRLSKILRKNRIDKLFVSQHIIHGYILDFFCDKFKIALEADGPIHGHKVEWDRCRDVHLKLNGIDTLRFDVVQLASSPAGVAETIQAALTSKGWKDYNRT